MGKYLSSTLYPCLFQIEATVDKSLKSFIDKRADETKVGATPSLFTIQCQGSHCTGESGNVAKTLTITTKGNT